ncbi:MAG: thioredoxin domain-containing protein [Planctomycetota bacterium]
METMAHRTSTLALSLLLGLGACAEAPQVLAQEQPGSDEEHSEGGQKPVNRLADATSPYLFQHRHNPVDWFPWGEEALRKAKAENKPIFLSIGYAACHWCHVMERESFEDEATAKLMNESFINIKVDREERPDLDEIYMTAVVGMTGSGGWPMSVFLTPDLQPFYGGTYFPPESRGGLPSFKNVLKRMHDLWEEQPDMINERGASIAKAIADRLAPLADPADPVPAILGTFVEQSRSQFDDRFGGFGQAPYFQPKFPHASELLVLIRRGAALEVAGDDEASVLRSMVTKTLDAMARGGLYDQLGGGFHRYSTDREWLVPHFEKMLYDNALLLEVYAEAYAWTGEPLYRRVLDETVAWILREMQDESGGLYSTQDADSEGEEGRFFVWDYEQVAELCGDDAPVVRSHYGVRRGGNWEGHTILSIVKPIEQVAEDLGIDRDEVQAQLDRGKAVLFGQRSTRVRPGTDDKVLVAWNGMALRGLAAAYRITNDEETLRAAQRVAGFVLDSMRVDGRLRRSWRQGDLRLNAYLEDYAYLADGLVALFECDSDPRWLQSARDLCVEMDELFGDEDAGSFYFTAKDHEVLIARTRNVQESSQPSAIAMAVLAHLRTSLLIGDPAVWERGVDALRAHHQTLATSPIACPGLVVAVDFALSDPREVVIVGDPDDAATQALREAALTRSPWHHVTAVIAPDQVEVLTEISPIFVGKSMVDGKPAAWVCRRGVCEAPITEPALLLR